MRPAPVSVRRAAQEELPRAVRRRCWSARRRAAEIVRKAMSVGNVVDAGVWPESERRSVLLVGFATLLDGAHDRFGEAVVADGRRLAVLRRMPADIHEHRAAVASARTSGQTHIHGKKRRLVYHALDALGRTQQTVVGQTPRSAAEDALGQMWTQNLGSATVGVFQTQRA